MNKFWPAIVLLFASLVLSSSAQAVKLADGEAVGAMVGYANACMAHARYTPAPKDNNDKVVGERYGAWVNKNTANPGQVLKNFGHGLHFGMLAATQNDYAQCEPVLHEMIGFYEFFKVNADHLRPALKIVAQAKESPPAEQQGVSPPLGKYKQCTGDGASPEARCFNKGNTPSVCEDRNIELRQGGRGTYFGYEDEDMHFKYSNKGSQLKFYESIKYVNTLDPKIVTVKGHVILHGEDESWIYFGK